VIHGSHQHITVETFRLEVSGISQMQVVEGLVPEFQLSSGSGIIVLMDISIAL
jgi:hypothetical protein